MRTDANGKGVINILSAEKLYQMPKLYAASRRGCFQNCMNNCRSGRSGETKTGVFLRRSTSAV
ncbi:helicase HerA-like domain-containing protein [Escherichia coli]